VSNRHFLSDNPFDFLEGLFMLWCPETVINKLDLASWEALAELTPF
jgi:hypothetical protein